MRKPKLSELSLREKIGQTALVQTNQPGFNDLKKYPFGCLWASGDFDFGIDIDDIDPNLNKRDGWINIIKKVNSELKVPIVRGGDCATTLPPKEYGYILDPMTVGATGSEEFAYQTGWLRGRLLRHYGINWLWSPLCTLPSRHHSGYVGRMYTDDPDKLLSMNIATIKGLHDAGVGSTAKLFPGTDNMEYRDSHYFDSNNLLTLEEWWQRDGKVFQGMIDAGVDTIMTDHSCFPAVDNRTKNGRYIPASLSYKITTQLLKEEMGFKGLVFTDDVWMRSILSFCDDDRAKMYIECIKAGNDVVLGAKQDYIDIIEDAVNRGEISMERIDDACQRVLDFKEKIGLFRDDDEIATGDLDKINADMAEFTLKASKKAISLVRDDNKLFPLDPKKIKKVCIIYSGHDTEGDNPNSAFAHMQVMVKEFEKRGAQVHFQHGLLNSFASEAELEEISKNYDLIVYAGYLERWMPKGKGSFYGVEMSTFQNALRYGAEKSIGIGLRSPFMYYDFYYSFLTFINTYNHFPELMTAAVEAMYGEIPFEGGEPYELIPEYVIERKALFGTEEME